MTACTVLEQLADAVPINEATKLLPGNPAVQTLYRWVQRGRRGRRLQLWRVGGRTYVRRRDLVDFIAATNDELPEPMTTAARVVPVPASAAAPRHVADPAVGAKLDAIGL